MHMTLKMEQEETSTCDSDKKAPLKTTLYKTELCKRYNETGMCRYGNKCQFAHGMEELRNVSRHPKYKTTKCNSYWTLGSCPYGNRCRFLHDESDQDDKCSNSSSSSSSTSPLTSATLADEKKRLPLYMRECKHISYLSNKTQKEQPAVIVSANGTMTSFDESYRTGYHLWRTKTKPIDPQDIMWSTTDHSNQSGEIDTTLFRRECRHLEATSGEDYRMQYHEWRKTKRSDVMSVLSDSVEALIQFD